MSKIFTIEHKYVKCSALKYVMTQVIPRYLLREFLRLWLGKVRHLVLERCYAPRLKTSHATNSTGTAPTCVLGTFQVVGAQLHTKPSCDCHLDNWLWKQHQQNDFGWVGGKVMLLHTFVDLWMHLMDIQWKLWLP